jgi:hypothetical protein
VTRRSVWCPTTRTSVGVAIGPDRRVAQSRSSVGHCVIFEVRAGALKPRRRTGTLWRSQPHSAAANRIRRMSTLPDRLPRTLVTGGLRSPTKGGQRESAIRAGSVGRTRAAARTRSCESRAATAAVGDSIAIRICGPLSNHAQMWRADARTQRLRASRRRRVRAATAVELLARWGRVIAAACRTARAV